MSKEKGVISLEVRLKGDIDYFRCILCGEVIADEHTEECPMDGSWNCKCPECKQEYNILTVNTLE